tara:strand:+ start:472 stop:1935 length:1464 start_codon:yes stop_codon:yes gene_type:complete
MIPFAEWMPDIPAFNNPGATVAKNVLPAAIGYSPFPTAQVYSDALTAYCRGAFLAKDKAGAVYVYAGDATKLKILADAVWTDRTRAADPYVTAAGVNWGFVKWDETVIATNFSDEIQVITLGGANFANLAGSPPQAKHIAVARNFVILGNINDVGGDGLVPNRVHWSGLNNPETWTSSATTQADYEDLKGGGGNVQRVFGGEYAVVFQETTIWRMSYVGTPAIWQFDETAPGTGLLAPGLAAQEGDSIYFLSPRGFSVIKDGSSVSSIGNSKVDRFVLDDIDTADLSKCSAVVDSKTHRVYFTYPGSGAIDGLPNRMVVYDYTIQKWSYSEQDIQQLFIAATTGYTLDGLDSISTNIDSFTVSFDSSEWTGGRGQIAAFNSSNQMVFYTGTPMTATVETSEVQLTPQKRTLLTAVRPLVDGGSQTVQSGTRDLQTSSTTWTTARTPTTSGRANIRDNARYHRFRVNLSGEWTNAQGVEPEGAAAGWR